MATERQPVPDELLTPEEAAAVIKLKPNTLRKWRETGKGPKFFRRGIVVRYRRSAIDKWIDENSFGGGN